MTHEPKTAGSAIVILAKYVCHKHKKLVKFLTPEHPSEGG